MGSDLLLSVSVFWRSRRSEVHLGLVAGWRIWSGHYILLSHICKMDGTIPVDMTDEIYNDMALERIAKENFGVAVDIDQVIVRNADVSRTATATVFLTKKKQLMVFINGNSKLLLSDIKKIISRMGLKAELYFPPKGQPDYFDAIGREKFRDVFPGRGHISDQDIIFYRTLAPYNPALVLISEVKNGEIYQYDSYSHNSWRIAARFAYRRIKTS